MPSICGIVMSIVTTSGLVRRNTSIASTPFAASPDHLQVLVLLAALDAPANDIGVVHDEQLERA